ncbi:hypothetical protein HMPREF9597_01059 [Cutibacterium acnes HL005PA4]|nr:hypothetical protein HMPREF9567_00106 [Cutibacterium acnes HL013PA1]EFS54904.1 hypothetical protein HMPREF9593_02582 [Cutibacterium acnes HL046PA2]EFS79796.1 hypothetical protein HMPREF9597_01059 [Cutibacterium acnes HL005PA4]EFS99185.1 hypothetical protein HMPREF9609_02185 [Cutibacterium acnes HL027PA1]EFT31639.1 hypothetical protein HMPREF9595_00997 [Cutibacterium acnes HL005PA2]EFT53863.1 hypothetical protein HMPREF9569_00345 [Cutibacterium acnes HL078PA1]EGE93680.1 hypothetical protein
MCCPCRPGQSPCGAQVVAGGVIGTVVWRLIVRASKLTWPTPNDS